MQEMRRTELLSLFFLLWGLSGVRDLFEQAQESRDRTSKSSAATTIQAAYRGHQVRQKLDWELPSGSTLKDHIRGTRDEVPIPQVCLYTVVIY